MEERIVRIRRFVNSQKLYMWLIVFILLIHAAGMFLNLGEEPSSGKKTELFSIGDATEKKAVLEAKLAENKNLAVLLSVVSALILVFFLIGLILDVVILFLKINGIEPLGRSLAPSRISWTAWDIAKVIILFLFFGYILAIIESIIAPVFPSMEEQETLRSMINTTILNMLGISFIFYFTIGRYKQKLADLGVTVKNFFKNVFYGVAGYIATGPVLVLVLLTIALVATRLKYHPPPQPILELFIKEKKTPVLVYMSIFVGILGPIAEEIFFRGFMYNAIKKKMGILCALTLSSFLFALLHAHLVGFLPIMVLGLLLAYLYEKTGSLVPCITVHIIHNSVMVFFVFLMKELYF